MISQALILKSAHIGYRVFKIYNFHIFRFQEPLIKTLKLSNIFISKKCFVKKLKIKKYNDNFSLKINYILIFLIQNKSIINFPQLSDKNIFKSDKYLQYMGNPFHQLEPGSKYVFFLRLQQILVYENSNYFYKKTPYLILFIQSYPETLISYTNIDFEKRIQWKIK